MAGNKFLQGQLNQPVTRPNYTGGKTDSLEVVVNKLKELVTSTEVTDDHNHEVIENVVSNEAVDTTTANDANAENVISE